MKCRILVVEDDASFGMMIQTWLKKNAMRQCSHRVTSRLKLKYPVGNSD